MWGRDGSRKRKGWCLACQVLRRGWLLQRHNVWSDRRLGKNASCKSLSKASRRKDLLCWQRNIVRVHKLSYDVYYVNFHGHPSIIRLWPLALQLWRDLSCDIWTHSGVGRIWKAMTHTEPGNVFWPVSSVVYSAQSRLTNAWLFLCSVLTTGQIRYHVVASQISPINVVLHDRRTNHPKPGIISGLSRKTKSLCTSLSNCNRCLILLGSNKNTCLHPMIIDHYVKASLATP